MNLTDFLLTVSISTTFGFVLGFFFKSLIAKLQNQWRRRKQQPVHFEQYTFKDDVS